MTFKTEDDGKIQLLKLTHAWAGIFAGMTIALRLEYLQPETLETASVQLAMDTEQAQFLIDLLQTAVSGAQQSPPDGTAKH
jgi:hypothetical protein